MRSLPVVITLLALLGTPACVTGASYDKLARPETVTAPVVGPAPKLVTRVTGASVRRVDDRLQILVAGDTADGRSQRYFAWLDSMAPDAATHKLAITDLRSLPDSVVPVAFVPFQAVFDGKHWPNEATASRDPKLLSSGLASGPPATDLEQSVIVTCADDRGRLEVRVTAPAALGAPTPGDDMKAPAASRLVGEFSFPDPVNNPTEVSGPRSVPGTLAFAALLPVTIPADVAVFAAGVATCPIWLPILIVFFHNMHGC